MSGRIELRKKDGTAQHYLDDVPLSDGMRLQVLLENGSWLEGIYSWNGVAARWPGLRIELGGPVPAGWPRRPAAVMALPPQATVRRPPVHDVPPATSASGATPSGGAAARR